MRAAAPAAAVAAVAAAVLIAAPAVADLAAHTYRAGLWEREGFVVWNANWYGGHHVPGYSLLFPPLGAWFGVRLTGGLAALAAVLAFGRITPHRGANWLFASGVAANLVAGRMPFVLGVAFATAAWATAADSRVSLNSSEKPGIGRGWVAAAGLSAATTLASPVAGIFLAGLALVRARARAALVVPAVVAGIVLGVLFPEGGTERFVATAFWPMFAISLAALALLEGRFRAAATLNAALLGAAFVLPTAMGQNAVRAGALLLPVALALSLSNRTDAPSAPSFNAEKHRHIASIALIAALTYLAWLPAVRAVTEAHGDPSTHAAFFDEVREIAGHRRTEVVATRNHWEATHLARTTPIARGWERQLDRKYNALFYEGRLTADRYRAWLLANGVQVVALPRVKLDYSARTEAALLGRGVPGLAEVHHSNRWLVWEVKRVTPPAQAVFERLGPDRFAVEGGGELATAERWTRYWRVVSGHARLRRRRSGRVTVVLTRPQRAVIAARLTR